MFNSHILHFTPFGWCAKITTPLNFGGKIDKKSGFEDSKHYTIGKTKGQGVILLWFQTVQIRAIF